MVDFATILVFARNVLASEAIALGYAWNEYKKQADIDKDNELDPEEFQLDKFMPLAVIAFFVGLVSPIAVVSGFGIPEMSILFVSAASQVGIMYVAVQIWKFFRDQLKLGAALEWLSKKLFAFKDLFKVKK